MEFTYENNILYLPCYEATNLKAGKSVFLLFEVQSSLINEDKASFNYNKSEPKYPDNIWKKDLKKYTEKFSLNRLACVENEENKEFIYSKQLASFWHFVGDGTHYSEPVLTPFGFFQGQIIQIENRYNVKTLDVLVKNITLTRLNEAKWFWLVELGSLS